jgi:hypothetical protein
MIGAAALAIGAAALAQTAVPHHKKHGHADTTQGNELLNNSATLNEAAPTQIPPPAPTATPPSPGESAPPLANGPAAPLAPPPLPAPPQASGVST